MHGDEPENDNRISPKYNSSLMSPSASNFSLEHTFVLDLHACYSTDACPAKAGAQRMALHAVVGSLGGDVGCHAPEACSLHSTYRVVVMIPYGQTISLRASQHRRRRRVQGGTYSRE